MAASITYNTGSITLPHIYRATGGGVTFSANLSASSATMDYFTDTAVVDDAIYFGNTGTYPLFSDLNFNIGTPMAGTGITLVWEYWGGPSTSAWVPIEKLQDDTVSFTATGAKTVRFPIQLDHPSTTVNSVSALWVRCRISAKTTITEGGKNQTTAVTASDGKVNIDDYTDDSPCTWTDVYNYMTDNYPYVGVVKNGNYFDFRRILPIINSRLLSKNETIEMCPSCKAGGATPRTGILLDYLTNGQVSTTDPTRGINGSTYLMNGAINTYPFSWGTHHYSYDTQWLNPSLNSTGAAGYLGYPALYGTFQDCKIQMVPGAPHVDAIIQNCKFNQASGFIATGFACNTFANNTMMVIGSNGAVFNIYTNGFSVEKLGFTFSSTGSIYRFNQTPLDGQVWSLINPLSRTPGITIGQPQTVSTTPAAVANFTKVFFYDDSAGTYTDYTTVAALLAGDVPMSGDVGDCLYMNFGTASAGHSCIIDSTLGGTNDYVYAFEYYSALGWTAVVEDWDNSNNFTQSGFYIPRKDQTMTTSTVNGVSGIWGRFRIVTKGTGTPAIDKIRRAGFSALSHWSIHERYDIEFTGIDSTSTPIQGIEVSATDVFGTVAFTGTSGVDGTITPSDVLDREFYFDPEDPNRNTNTMITMKSYNPYTTRVRKYGYMFQEFSTTVDSIQKMKIMLAADINVVASQAVAHAYTGISVDGVTNTITISEDHTMQEVYDYCEDWASLTANMGYNEPFVTTDGQNFTSTYDLAISAALSGIGKIDLGVNNLTLSGTSTLDIYAANGDHINASSTLSGYGYII